MSYPPVSPPMKVELFINAAGHGTSKVLLDGCDVTHHVRAVRLSASVDDITTVQLDLVNVTVSLDGEAFVDGVVIPVTPGDDVTAMNDEHRRFKGKDKS